MIATWYLRDVERRSVHAGDDAKIRALGDPGQRVWIAGRLYEVCRYKASA